MKTSLIAKTAALLLLAALWTEQLGAAPAVRFFALGDLPYSDVETRKLESLLAEVAHQEPPFLVHVGDVKSGHEPCTDEALGRMAHMFRVQPVPVVFTPGDNEWTDCRRDNAGGHDANERLTAVRRLYFDDPEVLRLQALGVSQPDMSYPENYWFMHGDILFATVHVVGSHNNLHPKNPRATEEAMARSKANRRHLRAATKAANDADAQAFVLIFHANPGLRKPLPPRGYRWLREDLTELLQHYAGPVLVIHGDTHNHQFDHPLLDPQTGKVLKRFSRLEVPGSPTVAGVWVRVDPHATQPFSVQLASPQDPRSHLVD